MKNLGYFTKKDLVKLLALLEKEGLAVSVSFDEKFAEKYLSTFKIEPMLRRRSTFKVPEMGWCIGYEKADEPALHRVLINSNFAYLLNDPVEESFPEADEFESKAGREGMNNNSGSRVFILVLVGCLIAAGCFLMK